MGTEPNFLSTMRQQYESAINSAQLEGFVFTQEDLAVFEKIIRGEITEADYIDQFKEEIEHWKKAKPLIC
ncbi:MAG TPA: antitoxin VbhA family protein [Firmicutes bacterium]|jgi:hypothetical protein|nr:antitoxin VbhA family protein [Bacillota bacterium]